MHPQDSINRPQSQEAKRGCALGNVHISAETLIPTSAQAFYLRRASIGGVEDHTRLRQAPKVTVLPGGMVAKQFKGFNILPPCGIRGPVCGFSPSSSRRLKLKLMRLNTQACELSFVTLTWHNFWHQDWREWKKARRRFEARLKYYFPGWLGHVWRLEFQKRGAPHFHLLIGWKIGKRPQEEWLTRWIAQVWNDCIGAVGDRDHLKHGAKCINVQESKGGLGAILGYLCKEMGKSDQAHLRGENGELLPTGRTWGIVGNLPMGSELEIELTPEAWEEFCERVQAYGQGKGWYLGAINSTWAGFVLLGDGEDLVKRLLCGLDYREVT